MVHRCCHRPQHCPPRLSGSLSPPPHCARSWHCRRGTVYVIVCAREFFHWLAKFMGGFNKNPAQDIFCENYYPSSLTGDIFQADQDSFCGNDFHDFLQLPQLLSTLNHIYHVANVKKLMLRRAELLCGSILDHCLHHSG